MTPRYLIRPHPRGGVALSGPRISHGLWYLEEMHAVSFAHHIARDTGGLVIVLDSTGSIAITERIPTPAPRRIVPGLGMTV